MNLNDCGIRYLLRVASSRKYGGHYNKSYATERVYGVMRDIMNLDNHTKINALFYSEEDLYADDPYANRRKMEYQLGIKWKGDKNWIIYDRQSARETLGFDFVSIYQTSGLIKIAYELEDNKVARLVNLKWEKDAINKIFKNTPSELEDIDNEIDEVIKDIKKENNTKKSLIKEIIAYGSK